MCCAIIVIFCNCKSKGHLGIVADLDVFIQIPCLLRFTQICSVTESMLISPQLNRACGCSGIDSALMVNEDVLQNKAYGDAWSAFYEGAIEPFAIQFSEVMTKMLFTLREQAQGNLVQLLANRLMYMTDRDKLNVSSQLLDRGIMSINDVREIWNLPPVDGGDARIIRGEYWNADEKINEEKINNEE